MSSYIDHVKEGEFIQFLRSRVKPEDLEEFDKMVEEKIKEYNAIWLDIQPELQKYHKGVQDVRNRTEDKHRSDKK